MKGFVYIIECDNGKLYTESTQHLSERLSQHWQGKGSLFTRKHTPKCLCYLAEFNSYEAALEQKKQIQSWPRAKKIALIKGSHKKLNTGYKKNCLREIRTKRWNPNKIILKNEK